MERFHARYVEDVLDAAGRRLATADLVATLTRLTARTVAGALRASRIEVVFASGGGVRNPVLMARLAEELPGVAVRSSDELGAPPDAKEAIAFALIGWATLHGLPGNVPGCTGAAGPRVLGSVTPGRNGWGLARSSSPWPTRLVLT
jgi:anhydro-N-acetylmuramic acid kinase